MFFQSSVVLSINGALFHTLAFSHSVYISISLSLQQLVQSLLWIYSNMIQQAHDSTPHVQSAGRC